MTYHSFGLIGFQEIRASEVRASVSDKGGA